MGSSKPFQKTLAGIVRDRMAQSGVDNYRFTDGELSIGSARYTVEACGCGEVDCDGLRLLPILRPLPTPVLLTPEFLGRIA